MGSNDATLATARPALLTRLADWVIHLPQIVAVVLAFVMMLVLSIADILAPLDFHFGPFYILPVCLCAWSLGKQSGYLMAAIAAIIWSWTQVQTGTIDGLPAQAWNVVTRFISNAIVAGLLATLRTTYDRERMMARTDGLTGALNRRAFQDAIREMLGRARRKGDVLVISYTDLDGFKAVNDTHGHAAGDDVLNAFARAAERELTDRDVLARIGGDEFVLIQVSGRGEDYFAKAAARHERLTAALRETPYDVTCSMGVVIVQGGQTSEDRLVALADALLYEVKRSGKNALRIAVANDTDGEVAS